MKTNTRRTVRRAALAAAFALAGPVLAARSGQAAMETQGGEWTRVNTALAWGLGGALVGYYSRKMDYPWFRRVVSSRFSPTESAFLVGGWIAFLSYTGYGAALARSGRADAGSAPASASLPDAWPAAGVDADGRAIVGATVRF